MAASLIDSLPPPEQAFWALRLYAELRRGERRALRTKDVDLSWASFA
jgi:hypothetical protein